MCAAMKTTSFLVHSQESEADPGFRHRGPDMASEERESSLGAKPLGRGHAGRLRPPEANDI
jgi:hypothetical protein